MEVSPWYIIFFKFFFSNFIYLFTYGCPGFFLLCSIFFDCGKWGLLSGCGASVFIVVAFLGFKAGTSSIMADTQSLLAETAHLLLGHTVEESVKRTMKHTAFSYDWAGDCAICFHLYSSEEPEKKVLFPSFNRCKMSKSKAVTSLIDENPHRT